MKANRTKTPGTAKQIAHIFIFSGVSLVGQKYFAKDQVAIGRGAEADLVLPGKGIADLQALKGSGKTRETRGSSPSV